MTVHSVRTPVKGRVALEEVETGAPEPGQLTVRLAMSAVSPGTERAIILRLENTGGMQSGNLGYAAVGTVEAVGDGVDAERFAPGTRVSCFTLRHQEVGNVSAFYSIPTPPEVDDRHAALTSIGQIALQGVRKARIELGEAVAVFGLGPIGLTALSYARLAGAHPVIGIDRAPNRLELARRMGADVVVDTGQEGWQEDLAAQSGGDGPAVVVESTGFPEPVSLSFAIAGKFARVVLLGSTRAQASFNPYAEIHRPALTVIGAHVMSVPQSESRPGYWTWHDDASAYLRLVASGRLDLEPMMETPVHFRDMESVYSRVIDWDPTIMVPFLRWRES